MNDITFEELDIAVKAALRKSSDIGVKMNIAVVDNATRLKAFYRESDAWEDVSNMSLEKAQTACNLGMNTCDIESFSKLESQLDLLNNFPGGVPLKNSRGDIIGAIGVYGNSVDNDHIVAKAGADALLSHFQSL